MSQILTKSPKHCGNKQGLNVSKFYKKLFCTFSTIFLSILLLIFLVYFILHPSKPQFSLKETDIYELNLSNTHLLNSSIQFTLLSKNPNNKVGIYYDVLQVYASYKGQQITTDTSLPPFYQGNQESNLLTGVFGWSRVTRGSLLRLRSGARSGGRETGIESEGEWTASMEGGDLGVRAV
ncbi:hypothetical protein HYC85_001398 [Camellia sinensis]|uniref:Late embryogenesis abundant protein LEA-2 subgroup domain-containing protein n=1 Tax=Camellia sinensis TaxID=4442 RepID=A0A7J7I5K3_CAMSI|nr:hypothetical protein HYC85_001398 [Camellia sinensis]